MRPPDLYEVRQRLGGVVSRGGLTWQGPGPGHSRRDMSLKVDVTDDSRILLHSFVDDPRPACEAHLGFRVSGGGRRVDVGLTKAAKRVPAKQERTDAERTAYARRLWQQAVHPAGTPVEPYLARRDVTLPPGAAGEVVRWLPDCPFTPGVRTGCMVAVVRDISTDRLIGFQRTALTADGRKAEIGGVSRLSLGPIGGGAVKLTPDAEVTTSLGIGEGLESVLSMRLLSGLENLSVWSLLAANQMAAFPVLAGIQTLWICIDHDPTGIEAAAACRRRWQAAGREVVTVTPRITGADMNDVARRTHAA